MSRRSQAAGRAPRAAAATGVANPAGSAGNSVAPASIGAAAGRRWAAVDASAAAILAMIAYHFCFDLAWNGWLVADFVNDWRWIWFRTPILGSFLFIAGVSLGLAEARGQGNAQFWRRVGIIAGAAALVSLGSYLMFPQSFIYFGVLHAIALMSVLARPVARRGAWTIALGLVVLAIGITVQHPLFDRPLLHWMGLMTSSARITFALPLVRLLLIGAGAGACRRDRRAAARGRVAGAARPRLDGLAGPAQPRGLPAASTAAAGRDAARAPPTPGVHPSRLARCGARHCADRPRIAPLTG
jgi:uncharacterized membrane protein